MNLLSGSSPLATTTNSKLSPLGERLVGILDNETLGQVDPVTKEVVTSLFKSVLQGKSDAELRSTLNQARDILTDVLKHVD